MNLATLLVALIATSAAEASGDPVLLDFQATWCGPCREMRPEVDKLVQKGYPVRQVDIARSPELSSRYNVTAVPTFIIIDAKGKELARTFGAMPAVQLAEFYNETKLRAAAQRPIEEAQERGNLEESPASEADAPAPLVNPKPWETVVRIKMHLSDSEWGFGSGTIIYSSAEESIILTCAHIFRVKGQQQPSPKNFRVPISVDLFNGQFVRREPAATLSCSEKDIPGEAIDYDFTNDVGLIRIRPGRRLAASRVVPAWWKAKRGMKMYTVGCSHGQDATAWDTTILDPRVGMSNTSTKQGFATIKCAYQPKEGRSGGGLYTTDGYVAGVCDFADPNEHVGLYAVPEAIHKLLDRNMLTALYKPPTNGGDVMLAANRTRSKDSTGTRLRTQSPDESSNPDAVTLPPPSMVGVSTPPSDAWRTGSLEKPAPRRARTVDQPDSSLADSRDARVRPGTAQQTELEVDPGPDARALEDSDGPATAPAPKRAENATSPTKPKMSGWKPVRQPSPDLAESRDSSR
jgi:thiol-disulfide isomerase/thioredoxin